MKRNTKIAIAATAALVTLGGIAYASQEYNDHRKMHREFAPEKIMKRVDTNGDGAAGKDEVFTLLQAYFESADINADGKLTKAEVVTAIDASPLPRFVKYRSGRMADRIILQGDINLDGFVALEELQNRVGKVHAIADWNDDGKVEMAEAKRLRAGFGRHHRKGGYHERYHDDESSND